MPEPSIHFSIDDVESAFSELFRRLPETVFDIPLFSRLKALHLQYGLKATLYVVGRNEVTSIMDYHNRYCKDFFANRDWLRFGLHCTSLSRDNEATFFQYDRYLTKLEEIVGKEAMSDTVRLHRFCCTAHTLQTLKDHGVKTLLSADDDRISYLLTQEENASLLANGHLTKDTMAYLQTAYRLESDGSCEAHIAGRLSQERIPIFTHECFFYKPYADRMELWLSAMLSTAQAHRLPYCL